MIYRIIFRQRFQNGIRNLKSLFWDYLVGVFCNLVMYMCIYDWIYKNTTIQTDMTMRHVFTYLLLVQLFYHISAINWEKLGHKVSRGEYAYDLLLPYSYPGKVLAEAIADFCSGMLIKVLPVLLLLMAMGKLVMPLHAIDGVLAFLSLLFGILIRWCLQIVLQMIGLWYQELVDIKFIMHTTYRIFCGLVLPYWFLPPEVLTLLQYTPFFYIWFLPMEIYFGKLFVTEACVKMLIQVVWIGFFVFLVKKLYVAGKRRVQAGN